MAFTQVIKTLGSVMASMKTTVDTWLSQNITNPSNPPLDRSLSLSNACAPADMVGELKNNISNMSETVYNENSAIGFDQTDYYASFYSLSYNEALEILKTINTAGTWNDNVYTTTGGGTVTINPDLTFTVDNSASANSASMWLPYFHLEDAEKVFVINRSNIRCTIYKVSTNKGNITNNVLEYTAAGAGSYRLAVRAEAGTSGIVQRLMVTKVLPLINQMKNAENRITELENGYVYHVGVGLDYETFTACIRALANDTRQKTIYIHSGTYDIFEETGGASYWGSFTGDENDWRQYNDIIPPNTTIIGVGNVNLNFMPSGIGTGAISSDASHIVSPINISGSCTLENLTINADNCRYAIHDETSGDTSFKGAVKKYKNIRVNRYTTYFTSGRYKHNDAFACGFDDEMRFEFENCNFYADTNGTPFRFHDRGTARTTIVVYDCVIHGNGSNRSMIRLEDVSNNETAHTIMDFSGCYIGGRIHLAKSSGSRNPFDITLLNCTSVAIDIDSTLTNPFPPKVYSIN